MSPPLALLKNLGPAIALGLFVGRVASELAALGVGSISPVLAVAFTAAAVAGGIWLTRDRPFAHIWPLLALLAYVAYPEANLDAALFVALFSACALWQVNQRAVQPPGTSWIARRGAPLLLLLATLILYVRTLAPDILPADSGEFQLVAANLGVAHPPGFPLYTMLAHLITRLPLGPTPAYRVNLFSTLTSVLTLATVFGALALLTRRTLPGIVAMLVLGGATTFWSQATTANIRSLTALFAALMLFGALGFYRSRRAATNPEEAISADRWLVLLGLLTALGVTHHASLAFLGLVVMSFVLLVDPGLLRPSRRWLAPLLAALLGLLPLLYLPLRAGADVRGASPALATFPGFLEHILALGFRGDFFVYLEPDLLWQRLGVMVNVLTFQFAPTLLAAMIIGLLATLRADWRVGFLLGGSVALFTVVAATYRAPQTVEYMLPAYVALALLAGYATTGLPARLDQHVAEAGRALLVALLLVAALAQFAARWSSFLWLHENYDTRRFIEQVLLEAPPESLVLADWHWATPLWYVQEVEQQRRDNEVRFVYPEGEPYGVTWADRISEGLAGGRTVVSTHFDASTYGELPVAEPLGEAFLFRHHAVDALPQGFAPLDVSLGEAIQIAGFTLEKGSAPVGEELIVTVAWQPLGPLPRGTSLFAHLLDGDGRLWGQQDLPARPRAEGLTLTQFRVTPRTGALPGAYTLVIGAYAAEPLAGPNGELRTPLAPVGVEPSPFAPATGNSSQRRLLDGSGRMLVGYDWDQTLADRPRLYLHWATADGYVSAFMDNTEVDLPAYAGPWGVPSRYWADALQPVDGHYVPLGQGVVWTGRGFAEGTLLDPGQDLVLTQHFRSSGPVLRDQAVSVRLIGYASDSRQWDWWDLDDAIPAMGAIPTLKWIADSRVRAPHFVTVSPRAEAGQRIGGALTLYDAFTARPLPILDGRLAAEYGWIPLGEAHAGP